MMKAKKSVPKVSPSQKKKWLQLLTDYAVPTSPSPANNSSYNVVLDTNVLVSGLFYGGNAEGVMRHVIASQQFITSDYIIDELVAYVRLVGPKVSHRWVNGLKRKLLPYAKKYDRGASHPLRDMSDSPILQLAVDNSALIVTGDKDLLDFNGQSNMLIVYISEYLALFDAASR